MANALKIKQILLLAFSSDQPGEVASAVAKVREIAKSDGVDIHQLADRLSGLVTTSRSDTTREPNFDADCDPADLATWALKTHMDRRGLTRSTSCTCGDGAAI